MRSEKESRNGTKVIKLSQNRDEKCKDVTKTKKVVDFLIAMDILNGFLYWYCSIYLTGLGNYELRKLFLRFDW